jgi:hypothetical protein
MQTAIRRAYAIFYTNRDATRFGSIAALPKFCKIASSNGRQLLIVSGNILKISIRPYFGSVCQTLRLEMLPPET